MARTTSQIDQAAIRTFHSQLPANWISNQELHDQRHIDYSVFELDGYSPTGVEFRAQVKGSDSPTLTEHGYSKSFETKHLEYWLERCPQPVFLIFVDNLERVAYYRFVHDWNTSCSDQAWREQLTATIHFPARNRVADTARFLTEVRDANEVYRSRRGTSLAVLAAELQDRLRQIAEPRTDAALTVSENRLAVIFETREPIAGRVEARSPDAIARLQHAARTGEAVTFSPGELSFGGEGPLAVLDTQASGIEIEVQLEQRQDLELRFSATSEDGARKELLLATGDIWGGTENRQFACRAAGGVIEIAGRLLLDQANGVVRFPFDLKTLFGSWYGRPLLALPYFQRVSDFYDELSKASDLELELEVAGTARLTVPTESQDTRSFAASVVPALETIRRLREAARRLHVTPQLPELDRLSDDEKVLLESLLALVENARVRTPAPEANVRTMLTLTNGEHALTAHNISTAVFSADLYQPVVLFGEESPTHIRGIRLSPLSLSEESESRVLELIGRGGGTAEIDLLANDSTEAEVVLGARPAQVTLPLAKLGVALPSREAWRFHTPEGTRTLIEHEDGTIEVSHSDGTSNVIAEEPTN